MNTRQEIIKKINRIDDPELLQEIDKWIGSILEASISDEFSKAEIEAVHEGYKQYRAGDIVSQEKANQLFNEWLKEK